MKQNQIQLLNALIDETNSFIATSEQLQTLSEQQLTWRENSESWNILECLEHLNRYGDFYIPEIGKRIEASNTTKKSEVFKSGWLGNYSANSMLPKEGKIKKINTFKNMNPLNANISIEVITTFLDQQRQMVTLLEKAKNVDLNRVKTSISISNLIKFKLGDTFRFVIFHNKRHFIQIQGIMQKMKAIFGKASSTV